MPYLVDGHNLVPKVGLRLDAPDDELALLEILKDFSRRTRAKIEVFFDGAPPGQDGTRHIGTVTAHFVRLGTTADAAIQARLKRLGGAARNWTVVSSDRAVQASAREAKAHTASSEDFARRLVSAQRSPHSSSNDDARLSDDEVEAWLELFRKRP